MSRNVDPVAVETEATLTTGPEEETEGNIKPKDRAYIVLIVCVIVLVLVAIFFAVAGMIVEKRKRDKELKSGEA